MTVAQHFSMLLDREAEDALADDLQALDRWLLDMLARNERALPRDAAGRRYAAMLASLGTAVLGALMLHSDDEPGAKQLNVLACWMRAREIATEFARSPADGSVKERLEPNDCVAILFDMSSVIESMELDRDWGYLINLRAELDETPSRWPLDFQWFASSGFDSEEAMEEIDAAYETRDTLEWALNCLTYFKLEWPGRLADLDVDHYRRMLTEPDQRFREVVAKAKREGWHRPDSDAPKSFWWRQP